MQDKKMCKNVLKLCNLQNYVKMFEIFGLLKTLLTKNIIYRKVGGTI